VCGDTTSSRLGMTTYRYIKEGTRSEKFSLVSEGLDEVGGCDLWVWFRYMMGLGVWGLLREAEELDVVPADVQRGWELG
jgi:hypothetical protein